MTVAAKFTTHLTRIQCFHWQQPGDVELVAQSVLPAVGRRPLGKAKREINKHQTENRKQQTGQSVCPVESVRSLEHAIIWKMNLY